MFGEERVGKLRWRCRRGMKELDLLLGHFLDTHAEALRSGAWPELEKLLTNEDDRLWDWLQDPSDPRAAAFRGLLLEIRHDRA